MNQSNHRMGYSAIATWIADELPAKSPTSPKSLRTPVITGEQTKSRTSDVPAKVEQKSQEADTSAPDTNEWILWSPDVKGLPLDPKTDVVVMFRDGDLSRGKVGEFCWGEFLEGTITLYRVVKQQPLSDTAGWIEFKAEDPAPKLDPKQKVAVRFYNGEVCGGGRCPWLAGDVNWDGVFIVAYKPI